MSLVNAVRFSAKDGAMISDEEYWLHGRRRTFFQDNLHSLLSPELANATGMELFYGGAGDPYFHCEVVDKARRKLAQSMAKGPIEGKDSPVYEAARQVLEVAQDVTRIRVEQKLELLYGFGVDDLNRGFFERDGRQYAIKQECVRKKAHKLADLSKKHKDLKELSDSRALIMGYDAEHGVQLFYLNVENQVLSFNSGDYDTVGTGIYGAGQVFADYMRRKNMAQRLEGYPRVEAMVMLIDSALVPSDTYKAIGGYFNIIYIDGSQKKHAKRILHIVEERAKLAMEIVAAYKKGLLGNLDCHTLIDDLIFQNAAIEEIDEKLYSKAKDAKALDLFLRGYKVDSPVLEREREKQATPATAAGKSKRAKSKGGKA